MISVDMSLHQRLKRLSAEGGHRGVILFRGVTADVMIVDEVGGSGDIYRCLGGIAHGDGALAV